MRFRKAVLSICLLLFSAGMARAQTYPSHTIHIETSGIGGPADIIARLIAEGIRGPLGQPVVVDNRVPVVIYDQVAESAPDGYTLFVAGAYFPALKLLTPSVKADPIKDFAPITQTGVTALMLVVNPQLPVHTARDLIALAKSKPGSINMATGALGTAGDLGARLLESMAGVKMVNVAYKTTPEAVTGVVAGYEQAMMEEVPALMPSVQAGKMRALGVTTAHPTTLAPGIPALAESGIPGFEVSNFVGVYAPAKTPRAIIDRLNHEIVLVLRQPDIVAKLKNLGTEVVANSPTQFAHTLDSTVENWRRLLRSTGVTKASAR